MREKAGLLVVPVFAMLAAVVGWLVLGRVDTGPDVVDAKPAVRLPPMGVTAPAGDEVEDDEPEPPIARREPPPEPPPEPPAEATEGLEEPPFTGYDDRPGPAPIHPLAVERMQQATVRATSRRIDMLERMFGAASSAVPEGRDRDAVARVLDDAIARMRRVERRVESGELTYRDAATEIEAIRDAAAEQIADIVPADEAEAVKIRMGMRTPFTRRATPPGAGGMPFEGDGDGW